MSSNLERARDLFARGLEEHLARRWQQAERLYREALALAPGRPSLVFNLARLMLDQQRDAEAEQLFRQVLQVSADDHEARYNLGVSLARQGRFEEALASYDGAIALRPEFAQAYSSRGIALGKLGRHEAALESHARSIELEPGSADFQVSFCRCASIRALDERKLPVAALERAVLACLTARNVDYQALGRISAVILHPKTHRLRLELEDHDFAFSNAPRIQFCNDPLLLASLEKIQIADRANEALFTRIRSGLLRLVARDKPGAGAPDPVAPLIMALAQQCLLNEYAWDVTEAEDALIAGLERKLEDELEAGRPSSAALGMIACYGPLAKRPKIAQWCRENLAPTATGFGRLLAAQLVEPAIEAEIASRLQQIGEIRDRTSLAVKAQYEENPYPRWLSVFRQEPVPYTTQILREIAPFSPSLRAATDAPRILIAGCGTGRHAIGYATAFLGSRVTAIDLSSASLAYASRKADELGVANIEFHRADILDLGAFEPGFDVISSVGVLHHMADPARGLQRLAELLLPGGYLMLGLYSELARRDIVELRSLIARHGFAPTIEGIRACRRFVRDHAGDRFRSLVDEAVDFYSTSMVRDLLFHVEEHRFTIREIRDLLAQNGLTFLGFTFADPAPKDLYRETYPGDPDMLDLDHWAELESHQPGVFRAMYQFWTAKTEVIPAPD